MTSHHRAPWRTDELRLLHSGMSCAQVAERTGRTTSAVYQYARVHGIRMPRRALRITPAVKTCSRCDLWKESAEFYRDERARDGLSASCKDCQCAAARESSRRKYAGEVRV